MSKLLCTVLMEWSIGSLNPQTHSLFAASPQKILTFFTQFDSIIIMIMIIIIVIIIIIIIYIIIIVIIIIIIFYYYYY